MKQKFNSKFAFLLFLVLLISINKHASARKLAAKEGGGNVKINNSSSDKSVGKSESIDPFSKLMGDEECGNEDDEEECLNRRTVAEAHLDYIYTQQHKT